MSRKVLGLEIRKESVAAVLLDIGFKSSELLSQGYVPISEEKPEKEEIKKALEKIVEDLKPAGAFCVLGIPASSISFRNISVPFNDTKKIKQILPFELEPTLPIPVEDLLIEFEAVKQEGHQDLLTFAVPKGTVQQYVDLLDSVNLRPGAIVPGGYAISRLLPLITATNDNVLFIDTGEGLHTVYAVCDGVLRLVRSFPLATTGMPVVRHLETNMKRTIIALKESKNISIDPQTVFAGGPQSDLLIEENEEITFLGRPVSALESIRAFPGLQQIPDSPQWATGQYDTALALALMEAESLKGINFSSEQSTLSTLWSEYRGKIVASAVLIGLLFTSILSSQMIALKRKQKTLDDLERRIESVFTDTFPDVTKIVDPLQQMQIKIRETGQESAQPVLDGARVRVIDILNALSLQIPKSVDVKINRMVVGVDNVVLSGNTDNFNTVDDIKSKVGEAKIFTNVTISSADLERSGKRVRFKLKVDF
jgi:general secretion pathway protein L